MGGGSVDLNESGLCWGRLERMEKMNGMGDGGGVDFVIIFY